MSQFQAPTSPSVDDLRGFAPTFDPGTGLLAARRLGLFYDILSSNLLVDAALRHYFSFKLIYDLHINYWGNICYFHLN